MSNSDSDEVGFHGQMKRIRINSEGEGAAGCLREDNSAKVFGNSLVSRNFSNLIFE